jgi:GT2 family glycosyltransferase/Flp pilus assembly protein TadD
MPCDDANGRCVLTPPSHPRPLSQSEPTVSIVIPVFNRADLTHRCLEALAVSSRGCFEVIVVDNGSTDETPELLASFGTGLTVIRNAANDGFARACNAGARRARGTYVVFLNNDTVPQPGWLTALVAVAEADPDVGVVGARLLYPDGTVQHAGIGFTPDFEPVHLHQGARGDAPAVVQDRDCEAVTGACLLLPRRFFLALGGFDEGYRMYFEDIDLCLRARSAGRRVRYAAGSVLIHLERGSSGNFAAAFALNRESRERFRARWVPVVPVAAAAVVPAPEAGGTAAMRRAATGLRVLFQARSNLFAQPGGDTVVIESLMRKLAARNVEVRFSAESAIPPGTDVVHTINFATPETTRSFARSAEHARVPLIITTLYEDWPRIYGLSAAAYTLFRLALDPERVRRGVRFDRAAFGAALARIRELPALPAADNAVAAASARVLLACGESERRRLRTDYPAACDVRVIPLGADQHVELAAGTGPGAFGAAYGVRDFVLCVGRLEVRKNQLMLIEALRDDARPLVLVTGGFTYNSQYAALCRRLRRRGPTLVLERLAPAMLAAAFREAAVHCLPSWYELPGLVSLEAARHGTRVAASSWGAIEDYLDDTIAYLEPDDPESTRRAVAAALAIDPAPACARARTFTWERTATEVLAVYEEIVPLARRDSHEAAGTAHGPAPPENAGVVTCAGEAHETPAVACGPGSPAVAPGRCASFAAASEPAVPESAEDACAAARRAGAAGDHERALYHAERAARAGADPVAVAELRAVALAQLRRFDEAERDFRILLDSVPHRRRAETGLGVIALERGDLTIARQWLQCATAAGGDADAWTALGLCLDRLARAEEAWQAYVEARAVDPAHRAALHGLITLAAPLNRLGDLERHLRDYIGRAGDDADVRYALAGCLYAAGRLDESRVAVREVLARAPAHRLALALDRELCQ